MAGLEQKIYGLPELLQRNKEIIVEVGRGSRSRDVGVVCGRYMRGLIHNVMYSTT